MTLHEIYLSYGLSPGYSSFGPRPAPFNDFHYGCDLHTPVGVEIHADEDGILRLSDFYNVGVTYTKEGIVNIESLDGARNRTMGHLSKVFFKPGAHIAKGQLLGITGNSGNSTGSHCHTEYDQGVFKGSVSANHLAKTTIDPLPYLKGTTEMTGYDQAKAIYAVLGWNNPNPPEAVLKDKGTYIDTHGYSGLVQVMNDVRNAAPWRQPDEVAELVKQSGGVNKQEIDSLANQIKKQVA